ncbi:DUF4183 domain-containing protein [Amphibacillus cookii]|uniref:DUF4183 domain-containing protein n=1 Tax=Amphibacillus cookii TaxID=767787 RepID=UPI001956E2E3|nr:DUF4183 domain-containing protein [Amphibacillus cookii]MBM7542074.1 hypothetical protein [Amphibacillus cookii]
MVLQLMKLAIEASTTTAIDPESEKYFYVTEAEVTPGTSLDIDAADFFDNTGTAVVELPELITDNSYYNVSVNGVLQMQGLTTYTPGATGVGSLEIDVPADSDAIIVGTPVVLEILAFDPTSTTEVIT